MNAPAPKCSCSCNEDAGLPTLVYPCSGAADTVDGARQRGDGVALKRSGRVRQTGRPPRGRFAEQLAGFTHVKHVRVTDLGFKKGQTPPNEYAIQMAATIAAAQLKN